MRSLLAFVFVAACAPGVDQDANQSAGSGDRNVSLVLASVETTPVASVEDAADDPAVWINTQTPEGSLILGTDKKAGLYVYDLSGSVKQFVEAGRLNNVDLRQGVSIGTWSGDIVAASNRSDDSITLFTINDGVVVPSGAFPSSITEPYGLCMGAAGGDILAFVAYKTGDLVMYRLTGTDSGEEIGRLKFNSQLEGCVFDDEMRVLYIGEEEHGIWRAALDGDVLGEPLIVDEVAGDSGVAADVEGLALYKTNEGAGYLMASSQGNNSYTVYDRRGDNAFLGRFAIGDGARIDGTQETDGIDAVSVNLGESFPAGLFIAQDGENMPKGSAQNFKIVDFRDIEAAINQFSATPTE